MKLRWLLITVAVAAVARYQCGDTPDPERPIDVDAVNALIPEDLRDDLTFDVQDVVEDRGRRNMVTYTVAAPRGWKARSRDFAVLQHPDQRTFFFTELALGHNCDGWCKPKDWNAVIDNIYAEYLAGDVIKNVKTETTRTLIAQTPDGSRTITLVAQWKSGDTSYAYCAARLEDKLQAAALAFEKACEVVNKR